MRIRYPLLFILMTAVILTSCAADEPVPLLTGDLLNYNGYYYKPIKEVDERSVERYSEKMLAMYDMYLNDGMNIYYTIVPTKSLYTNNPDAGEYYGSIAEILNKNINIAEYIEISDTLQLKNYYKTDDHWKQETLEETVKRLGDKMGFTIDFTKFTENKYEEFIGMYNSDIDNLTPETLIYLTSEYTENAAAEYFQYPDMTDIYNVEKLTSETMYDIYLSGVSPIITITNELADSDRELIIFRDSFASSLAPLLLEAYSKITLIDSRFIMMDLISDYVEFSNQDILFMHCDLIVNNSLLLK